MKRSLLGLALVGVLAVGAVGGVARADRASIDKEEQKCMDTAQSNVAMKMCAGQAYESAEKELNAQYKKLVSNLKAGIARDRKDGLDPKMGNAEILRRLVISERAWITFRAANCDLVATSSLGGTNESLEYTSCMGSTTQNRTEELQKL